MGPAMFASLVAAAIILAGVGLLAGIYLFATGRQEARMQQRLTPSTPDSLSFEPGSGNELLQKLAAGGKKIETFVDSKNETGRFLIQAGWRGREHRSIYYAAQILTPLALLGPVIALGILGPEKFTKPAMLVLFALMAMILGILLPRMALKSAAENRTRRIKNEVPQFIHLLVLLFESGLSTRQALASIVRDGGGVLPELGKEFELVLRQLEAGGDTDESLKSMAAALDLGDLTATTDLLRQLDRYGGEVRDPLLELLKVLEDRRVMDLREMVNLLSGRMTVVMVLFFFPALLIFVAGPAFVGIMAALGSMK